MAKLYVGIEDSNRPELRDFRRMVDEWDGEALVAKYDEPTDAWMFVAIHDLQLGNAAGGCRLRNYADPREGVRDAFRLAEGMTHKWAIIGDEFGGGKAVIALPNSNNEFDRPALFRRFGLLLNDIGKVFSTGEDLGTLPSDMFALAEVTDLVHGVDTESQRLIDSGPYTAVGVRAAMLAALEQVFGYSSFAGRRILIQGLGNVGGPLSRMLFADGAILLLADTNELRLKEFSSEFKCVIVPEEEVFDTECDLFAPCAVGGVITASVAGRIPARIICGAANNQLENEEVSTVLHQRGVLFAPDYVVNAGGAIAVPLLETGVNQPLVYERLEGIAATLREILKEAALFNESPLLPAARRSNRVLAEARLKNGPKTLPPFVSSNLRSVS